MVRLPVAALRLTFEVTFDRLVVPLDQVVMVVLTVASTWHVPATSGWSKLHATHKRWGRGLEE